MNLSLPFTEWALAEPAGVARPAPVLARAAVRRAALGSAPGDLFGAAAAAALCPGLSAEAEAATEAATEAERAALLPDGLAPAEPLERLHPALWRASQLGSGRSAVSATGFAALDAQLPGGGWPHGVLTELLLDQPGIGELRLLAPVLARLSAGLSPGLDAAPRSAATTPPTTPPTTPAADTPRCVMLFDPPAALSAWALLQRGLSPRHWLVVHGRASTRQARGASGLAPLLPSADVLWALEQALRSGHVGAVLAWLPLGLRAESLRRLQLAAQSCDGPVFIFRDTAARHKPSAAPLRLLLQPAGLDGLSLRLLKRRGPPQAQALRLALPPVLNPRQQALAEARQALQGADQAARAGELAGGRPRPRSATRHGA